MVVYGTVMARIRDVYVDSPSDYVEITVSNVRDLSKNPRFDGEPLVGLFAEWISQIEEIEPASLVEE